MHNVARSLKVAGVVWSLVGCTAETSGVEAPRAPNAKTATVTADGETGSAAPVVIISVDSLVPAALSLPIGLSAAQRAKVEGIVAAWRAVRPPTATQHVRSPVADAVRAGTVTEANMEMPAEVAAAFKSHDRARARALADLHATLTKEQRAALVDGVKATVHRPAIAPPPAPTGPARDLPFGNFLDGIELDDAQREALHSAAQRLAASDVDAPAHQARARAVLERFATRIDAFKEDAFDAASAVGPALAEAELRESRGRAVHALNAMLAVLTPEQREALARKIETASPPPAPPRGK